MSHMVINGKGIPGSDNKFKKLEARLCLVCPRNSKVVSWGLGPSEQERE